jgi:hypothetical protein
MLPLFTYRHSRIMGIFVFILALGFSQTVLAGGGGLVTDKDILK